MLSKNTVQQYLDNKPFVVSLVLNFILFASFLGIFYTTFGTTDDVEMQMVLAGKAVLQEPSANLRWTHLFIGYFLSTLYSWFPSIPWYGWYLTLTHFVGMTAILYSVLILKPSLFRVAIYCCLFAIGETALLQELQFTSSSIIIQIGAVFLLFTAFSNPKDKRVKKWAFFSVALFIFGAMIRWDSFLLIVVLGSPLLLYGIFQQAEKRVFNILFCLAIITAAWSVDQVHYLIQNQDKDWADFNEYKKLLSAHDILDYKKPQYNWDATTADDYYYKVGWEYEDYMMFHQWFFADSTVFGLRHFKALQETFQDCPYPEEHIQERLWQFFIETPLKDYVYYCFIILAISFLFMTGNRWLYATLGLSMLLVFALLASLYVYKHLPIRVSYPMSFYLLALAMLFMAHDQEFSLKTKWWSLALLGVLLLSNFKMITNESSKIAHKKIYWAAALDSLNAQEHQLYIGGGDFYMEPLMTPYQSLSDSMFTGFNMVDFGHLANCPTTYKQLENFNIENIHTQAPIDSNIYLLHRYDSPFLKWYASFVLRHYNRYIEYELVQKEVNPIVNIAVYRIKEQIRHIKNSQGINRENMHEFGLKLKDPNEIEEDSSKLRVNYSKEEEFLFK